MEIEGEAVNKQEQMTTQEQATRKFHINDLHANLGHPG